MRSLSSSEWRLQARVEALEKALTVLLRNVSGVTWFDWSDNDDDAVNAVERLREAEEAARKLLEQK